ncbi:MAG: hypothetical protein Q8K78_15620 [Planctomycetaceae bacterium]|nr:hypothetical protein [Planctomycetaceae bacterium]
MISRDHVRLIAGMACAFLSIAAIVGSAMWLWQTAAEIDRNPQGGFKEQMMHRKTIAMQDLLDGMIRGDLNRVETAADRLAVYGSTIDWYFPASEHRSHGEEFHHSVDNLIDADRRKDLNSAKEATLRLEKSCMDCHALMIDESAQVMIPIDRGEYGPHVTTTLGGRGRGIVRLTKYSLLLDNE